MQISQNILTLFTQPKRRRSSAQPALGGGSKRMSLAKPQDVLIEESEPEEESPVKKVGRTKKLVCYVALIFFSNLTYSVQTSAGQSRRLSHLVRSLVLLL